MGTNSTSLVADLFLFCNQRDCTYADPGGRGRGSRTPPPKKTQSIGFLSNTGLDALKNYKATKLTFNVGQSSARQ